MIGALVRKAVLAAKVAVVADMQAECLDLVRLDGRGGHLLFVEKSRILQALDVGESGFELLVRPLDGLARNVTRRLFVALVERAAARIVEIVMSVIMKNVYHRKNNAKTRSSASALLPALHSNSDLFDLLLSRDALAGLIAYGAARLACGLTGAPAFAAARDLFLLRFCDGTDHSPIPPLAVFLHYTTRTEFLQVIFYIHEILFEPTKRISVRLRETQQSPLALCSVSLCASSRNKIAPAHSLFRKSQRVGKLSTAAQKRGFACGIIIAKGANFSRLPPGGECVRYADSRGAASAHT